MMTAAMDIAAFMDGKVLILALVALSAAFALCVGMAFGSLRRAREILASFGTSERLKAEQNDLGAACERLRGELSALNDRRAEYARAQKFLEMQPHLEAEEKRLEGAIAEREMRIERLQAETKTLETRQRALEKVEEDLRKVSQDVADLARDKVALADEKKRLADEKATLTAQGAELKKRSEELEAQVKKRTEELEGLRKEAERLRREADAARGERESAQKWLDANKEKLRSRDDLDRQIADRREEVRRLDEKVKDGAKAVADTMARIDKGLDRLNQMNLSGVQTLRQAAFAPLQEGVFSVPRGAAAAEDGSEQEALGRVAAHLKASGFVVPERLLKAFHASLKTSDMSSLTVMAGVSGTGKSAIPKLYAEAMGIHFQPLAVEPRWDSPKDLMGFFNYVTNRYEPTVLARALFQFQGLHGKDFAPKADLHDYLLMPMLDEMNLARIEYYFSEFLSKLEMRRLAAPLTREKLGVVALEVFQGYKGRAEDGRRTVAEEPIRLFANTNTLFVGTMNEDETTQSLSDKVIDRANVLYFGRPDRLQARAGGVDDEASRKHRETFAFRPMRKTAWDAWHREVDEGALKFACETLSALNRTLAEFNRPFAHRTYQAMLAYIANYPAAHGEDADAVLRRALADQIGMRVMPKLYGVDLALHQDTLASVRRGLETVGDALLLGAFDNAANRELNKSGFFHWTGFDWNAAAQEG